MRAKEALTNKKGQSLLIAVCLMLIFVALSFAVLLSATQLTAGKQLDIYREQARIGAVTLMDKLELELGYTDKADVSHRSSIQDYLYGNMSVFGGNWDYYDENDAKHPLSERTFELKDALDEDMRIDSASVDIYWIADAGTMGNPDISLDTKCQSTKLIVSVNCTSGGETYSMQQAFDTVYSPGDGDEPPSLRWAYKEVAE